VIAVPALDMLESIQFCDNLGGQLPAPKTWADIDAIGFFMQK
jgi:hypothetical protein